MKKHVITYLIIGLSSLLYASETLVITGSSTIAPVMSDLAKEYESKNKDIRIDIQTGGSSRGILDIRNQISNIGMVSRKLKKSESDLIGDNFAKDGLAIIVNKVNTSRELTRKQIRDIYIGKIINWKELGGRDKKIVVVNKAEGRSTLELFLKFFKLKNSLIKPDIIIGDNEQGIKTVSTNKDAIAYVSIGAAEYNASVGVAIKLLKFEGVDANVSNVENGTYPLLRELNIITKMKPSGEIKKFIKFIHSKVAKVLIKEHFFVPVK